MPIPWSIIVRHEAQAIKNHGHNLVTLRRDATLSPCEALAILEDRPWRQMDEIDAINQLSELICAQTGEQ